MSKRTQRYRLAGVAVISAALFVPLTVYGGTRFANSSSAAEYQYKITICHHTHSKKHPTVTIRVSSSAWAAHQRHHDTLGACPPPVSPAAVSHGSSSTGNSNAHGNSHSNGGGNGNAKGHGK